MRDGILWRYSFDRWSRNPVALRVDGRLFKFKYLGDDEPFTLAVVYVETLGFSTIDAVRYVNTLNEFVEEVK